jgi:hypothetical protein
MKRIRIRDIPWAALDATSRPYFMSEGVLSAAEGFVPSAKGGYKRTPLWSVWSAAPSGEEIIGASAVGTIADGENPQITVATKKASANALYQRKVLSDGTWTLFGMNFGSSQDYTRSRIVYHRMGGKEYTLGWDPDAYGYHCHLFESKYLPAGAEPMNQNGITLTAQSSGGHMGAGYVRVYLVFHGDFSGETRTGAPDLVHAKTVHLTGTNNANRITVGSIPAAVWPGTTHVYLYRTRVVSDSAQLEYEPAYFAQSVSAGTSAADMTSSDAQIAGNPQLETGKFNFPAVGETQKFLPYLGLSEHAGRLICWGVKYAGRMWISGYTDVDGAPEIDNNWWGYSIDLPGRDTIVSAVSFRGKCFALGLNGLYRLRDESSDPSFWYFEQMALVRGENVLGLAVAGDEVYVTGKGIGGDWNIWALDGYNLRPAGDGLRSVITKDTGVLQCSGLPLTTGDTASERYMLGEQAAWGRMNGPAGAKSSIGQNASFASGGALLATAAGIYKEGSTYSADESDYAITREFSGSIEERTEWEKVFVFASVASASVTLRVYGAADGGAWVLMGSAVISATSGGMVEIPVPAECRQGRRFRVKVAVLTAAGVTVEGVTVQARPAPEMT